MKKRRGRKSEKCQVHDSCVEQACGIFYTTQDTLLLTYRGEGSLLMVEEREKRMIILCMVGIVYIHNYMGCTDHAVSCAQTMFGHAWQPKAALPSRCSDGSNRIIGCATRALSGRIIFGCCY